MVFNLISWCPPLWSHKLGFGNAKQMCDLPWLLQPTQVASDDGIPKDIIDGV